ncbi:MAG: hypothetical protein ACUVQT_07620 [bacterium]
MLFSIELLMKPDKPDSSGPDPCWVERRGFRLNGIDAGKLKNACSTQQREGSWKKSCYSGAAVLLKKSIIYSYSNYLSGQVFRIVVGECILG